MKCVAAFSSLFVAGCFSYILPLPTVSKKNVCSFYWAMDAFLFREKVKKKEKESQRFNP